MNDKLPLIDEAIYALSRLPGIGQKSAQRIAFYLLRRDKTTALMLGEILPKLVNTIKMCDVCRHFTEMDVCHICLKHQNSELLCIVESPIDLLAIEQSGAFKGRFFVLHGYLSPIDGIGPLELGLDRLEQLLDHNPIQEIIIATNGSIDGETTAHFLHTKLEPRGLTLTRIAQGIPIGGELEYTDSATLAQALYQRQPLYNNRF